MRSISSIITKTAACLLVLALLCPGAQALDDNMFTVGIISVKTSKLNPLTAEERDFQSVAALVFESLITLDDDYMPQPSVAESWEQSADAAKWTFHIREGITFHDGTPLTAYDVKATLDEILRLAGEGTGQYASLSYLIKSVTAADSTTLTLVSKRPYYGFLFAMTFPILPQSQVQADNPIGSGPYFVQAFSPQDYLYLTAYDGWWQTPPAIEQLNFAFFATNSELVNAYEYNRVDAAVTRSSSAAQYSRGTTSVSLTYRTQQLETLLMNHSSFPLNDLDVCKAVRYAINVDLLASSAYQGMVTRTDTPLPMGTWMYQDTEGAFDYDPEKAKQLLADAGWSDPDGDGMLNKVVDGKTKNLHVRLYVYEEQDNSVRIEAASLISSMLTAVGFGVETTSMSFSDASEKLSAGSFDLCLAAYQMDGVPDPGFLLMGGNTGNYCRYRSDDMDSLFDKLRKAADFDTYKSLLGQIQTQFANDCPFICLYYRTGAIMTRKLFTSARDVREPNIFRGIEAFGN